MNATEQLNKMFSEVKQARATALNLEDSHPRYHREGFATKLGMVLTVLQRTIDETSIK